MQNQVDGGAVIIHIQPFPDLTAIAVQGPGHIVDGICDKQRNELSGY